MAVFDKDPDDWRELQAMTGQLFTEIGCNVEVGINLDILRGAKEIDVYARDEGVLPAATYLCECKLWKRAVPQEIVHAFRAVLGDAGAHRGFIISSAGFQRGAFEAARNTNIDLVTFTGNILRPLARSHGRTVYAVCGPAVPLLGFPRKNAAFPVAR